jgi:pectin methylesterase-like acyl-CoA thioesterase
MVGGAGGQSGASVGAAGEPAAPVDSGPLFPANGATNVCADATLRMRFDGAPSVGNTGKIQVFKTSAPGSAVAAVDLATTNVSVRAGGKMLTLPRPVYVGAREVIVRLPAQALSYGEDYYVTVDSGAIRGPDGKALTISDSASWHFSTAAAAPSENGTLRVAVDGTGQYCSVQGALDALPAQSASPAIISIAQGVYFEPVYVTGKSNFTLRGADRKGTVILGVNNNNLNPSTSTRSLVNIENAKNVVIENLTIHNLTPQGGSQAEALRLQGCDQCVVRHADILSLQDTLLWSGRVYATDCYIAGNVDFVWGTGAVFFDKCEIKTVGRAGYVVQARNTATGSGYVFVDSKITADSGVGNIILGRIDVGVYPGSQVAYINCQMGSHIAPAGWTITGGVAGSSLRFWEYQSTDAQGKPLDVSRRVAGSKQISADQAQTLRDPANVLGGWTPPP